MKLDFKVNHYLPIGIVAGGVGAAFIGLVVVLDRPVVGGILILIGLVCSTTQQRVEVNVVEKYFREYVWLLGFRLGDKIKFNEINYFYITQSRKTQVYGQTYKNHTVTGSHFNGFLKFDDNEKVSIGDGTTKAWVVNRINHLNTRLKLEVKDYCTE